MTRFVWPSVRLHRYLVVLAAQLCCSAVLAQLDTEIYQGREVVARTVLVKFKVDASRDAIEQLKNTLDIDRDEGIGGIDARRLHSRTKTVAELLAALQGRADVEYAEPDLVGKASAVPNDPRFGEQTNLQNTEHVMERLLAGLFGAFFFAQASAEVNVDSKVLIPQTAATYNSQTKTYDVILAITNNTATTLVAPFAVVVTNVSSPDVRLVSIDGTTTSGLPFVAAGLEGRELAPQATTRIATLQFENPTGAEFTAHFSVYNQLTPQQIELATAASDMRGTHEGYPHGVPSNDPLFFDWYFGPRINPRAIPPDWNVAGPWGQVYTPVEGNPAVNTRVEIRDLQMFGLCRSTGKWINVVTGRKVRGGFYLEDFAGDVRLEQRTRPEPDGGVSVRLEPDGYNFHFGVTRRFQLATPNMPLLTRFRARLVRDNPLLPDDRFMARFIASAGGDYWRSLDAPWAGTFINNDDFAIGKFKYLTPEYRTFYAHNLSQTDLQSNPPPDWSASPDWYHDPLLLPWSKWAEKPAFGDRGGGIRLGDFDGNGTSDAFFYSKEDGNHWVATSNGGSALDWNIWANALWGDVYQRMHVGDFNADGKSDIYFFAPNGHYVIGLSKGRPSGSTTSSAGDFAWTDTATGFGDANMHGMLIGDFNGDGMSDVSFYNSSDGRLWVGTSNGDGTLTWNFWGTNFWGNVAPRMRVGDFNGDGKSDIYFFAQNGHYEIGLSNGVNAFKWSDYATGFGDVGEAMLVGDFNGDGMSDVFFYYSGDGNHWVGLSDGNGSLTWRLWGTHRWGNVSSRMRIGDFNDDGKSDIFFFAPNRHYLIGLSNGTNDFKWSDTATGFGDNGERIHIGDFDGDGRSDAYFFASDGNNWVWLNPLPNVAPVCP